MIRYGVIMIENGPRTSIYFDKNGILSIVLPTALPPEEVRESFENGVPTIQHSSKLPIHAIPNPTMHQPLQTNLVECYRSQGQSESQTVSIPNVSAASSYSFSSDSSRLLKDSKDDSEKGLEWINQLKIATYNSYLNSIINPNIRRLDLISDDRKQCEVCGEKYEGFMRYTKKVCRYCASFFTTARKEPELLVCQSGTYQCPVIRKFTAFLDL